MPITFVTLNKLFVEKAREKGFDAQLMNIEKYVPKRTTYYVSPANSLCFMDGGIDHALSRVVFPGCEAEIKRRVQLLGRKSLLGRPYLPIGSSLILDVTPTTNLVVAPTMLLPQDVSTTENAYYATMSLLYNVLVNRNEDINEVDILLTSMCCGYGKMAEEDSLRQISNAIRDYRSYNPMFVSNNIIYCEPNLYEQPKLYQNSEFFPIALNDITG